METVTPELIKTLTECEGPCVSIYLSPHRPGAGTLPARARLRRMLHSLDAAPAGLLDPLWELAGDPAFQADQAPPCGVALFRAPRAFHIVAAPPSVNDESGIDTRFLVTPLLENAAEPFYLLALSRKRFRLMRVTETSTEDVPFPAGVACEPASDLDLEDRETLREYQETHFEGFCHTVDHGLRAMLDHAGLPLVIAGVEEEVAAYRAVNTYPRLEASLDLSPDAGVTGAELAARARTELAGQAGGRERRAIERLRKQAPNRREFELMSMLRAASEGRVDVLLLDRGFRQQGDAHLLTSHVPRAGEFVSRESDLPNAAAIETLKHGGSVLFAPADHLPGNRRAAAILRY